MEKYVNELFDFIEQCPSPYHAVAHMKFILNNFKYQELKENEEWKLEPNKGYFVIRDSASIITFKTGDMDANSFHIVASHLDSPTFKLKPNFELDDSHYKRLNTEGYGGMLKHTWFDKPLGIAGRVMVKTNNRIEQRLVNLAGHTVIIPSLAIHLQRDGEGMDFNLQKDVIPVVGLTGCENSLRKQMEKICLFEDNEQILSHDLFLYNKERGTTIGFDHEMIAAPKLDDLECAYSSLEAFLESKSQDTMNVCAIFDNEEVGSGSNHGAASTFLTDTLDRICECLNKDKHIIYANSMLVSADNAHAVHPAYPERSDPTNNTYLNQGVVIKYHAGLSYTTEAASASIFKAILDFNNIPHQEYTNRSDKRGGSTLGHIQLEKLSIVSVDIGLAQLAMHSNYETAGAKDLLYMVKGLKSFYDTPFNFDGNNFELGNIY